MEIADEGEERGAMGMGTHAGGQTSREGLVWGKEISCLKERGDLVQANMPHNLWHHESVALQGEPVRFMWCAGGQRSELQPDPQKLNVSCISVAEKRGGGCSRLDTAGQGHTEAQLDHVLPQTGSFGNREVYVDSFWMPT